MAFPWALALQGGLGLLGLLQGGAQQRRANQTQQQAFELQQQALQHDKERQFKFDQAFWDQFSGLKGLAEGYDPEFSDRKAAGHAADTTQKAIERALGNFQGQYRAGGGQPGGDSEFRVRAQGMTDRIADPLRAFLANQAATAPQRKMQAMQALLSAVPMAAPGNLSDTLMRIAQMQQQLAGMQQPNLGPAAGMFGQGLGGLLGLLGGSGSGTPNHYMGINNAR